MRGLFSPLLFWGFLRYTSADIDFTWPSSGATLGSGDVTLWWKEDGGSFLIREMGSHLLVLLAGSNNVMTMLDAWVVPIGKNNTTIHPSPNLGPDASNSCFFGLQSTPVNTSAYPSTSTPVLINFSPRFSLTNMTGEDFSPSVNAANSICNTTEGPDSIIRDKTLHEVSLAVDQVASLSSAQMTTSRAIHNPTDNVLVTTIHLTPMISPTTSSPPLATTIISSSTPTTSAQFPTETTQTPTSTTAAGKKVVIAVPVAIALAAILSIAIFFIVRYRCRNPPSEKSDTEGSILPFFPPPPSHPNTWMDTTTSTLKTRPSRFCYRSRAKRPRSSVVELPGYDNPDTINLTSQRNISPTGATSTNASEIAHTPIKISPDIATGIPPTNSQNLPQNFPGREVDFLAVGPNSTTNNHKANIKVHFSAMYTNHLYPRTSTIKTITTESSGIPSSSALSSSFDRERGPPSSDFGPLVHKEREAQIPPLPPSPTALRATAKVGTISRTDSLLRSGLGSGGMPQPSYHYPVRKSSLKRAGLDGFNLSNSAPVYPRPSYQAPSSLYPSPQASFPSPLTPADTGVSQPKRFRSAMARADENAAVREAERRIRGLLGHGGNAYSDREGFASPVSSVSSVSR
ncbi:hypothetical protein EYC80_009425 [Monilinia laxa]|uniref:Mid2 domain-containing protein n=1 Tax=Monilinia laxa TaxID=61186 RepID=A0A5N6JXS4_MONLA|nr:hypothetical protein EYC80_009425 [Monilinia laxa]